MLQARCLATGRTSLPQPLEPGTPPDAGRIRQRVRSTRRLRSDAAADRRGIEDLQAGLGSAPRRSGHGSAWRPRTALGMRVSVLPMPGSLARMGESGLSSRRTATGGVMLARAALSLPGYERQLRDLLSAIRPGNRSYQRVQGTCALVSYARRCARNAVAHARIHQPAPADAQADPPLRRSLFPHHCQFRERRRGRADDHRQTGAASRHLQRCRSSAVFATRSGGKSGCARRAASGRRGDRASWPDRNVQPVEGPRHVSAGRGIASRVGSHPALHRRWRTLRHRRQPVLARSSCAGWQRRTGLPIASVSPGSSRVQTERCEPLTSSCTRARARSRSDW